MAADGEWRINAALGGLVERVDPPPLARALAIGAAATVRVEEAFPLGSPNGNAVGWNG